MWRDILSLCEIRFLDRDLCDLWVISLLLPGLWLFCFTWFSMLILYVLRLCNLLGFCIVRPFAAIPFFLLCVVVGVWDWGPFSLVFWFWVSHCWPCSTFITSSVGGWLNEMKLIELSEHTILTKWWTIPISIHQSSTAEGVMPSRPSLRVFRLVRSFSVWPPVGLLWPSVRCESRVVSFITPSAVDDWWIEIGIVHHLVSMVCSDNSINCGALTSAWINATTKVVIGTCASGATEPELCDVLALSVDRIGTILLGLSLIRSWMSD